MALKLDITRLTVPLEVSSDRFPSLDCIIREMRRNADSPHVSTPNDDDVIVGNFFEDGNRVPDVSRYCILEAGHGDRCRIREGRYLVSHCDVFGQELQTQLEQQGEVRNVVLLLESPHRDEYQARNIDCPIAPANGKTGDNIDRCLGKVLGRIDEGLIVPHCHVIISNPVQFQTSLHAIHGKSPRDKGGWGTLRDRVWKALWCDNTIRQGFQTRINSYRPSVIINCCTGAGAGTNRLRDLVEAELRCMHLQGMRLYRAPHPSSWSKCDNVDVCEVEI